MRAAGFTVALVGPDGAGKTTVARSLEGRLPAPTKYLYMGDNADAGNHMLPTTRLVRRYRRRRGRMPDSGPPPAPASDGTERGGIRAFARLANLVAEEWYRQLVAWAYLRRGRVVVFDRHFYADYYAHDVEAGRAAPLTRRLHGALLSRVYPKPDLVVQLDAAADVLLQRKGEGTVEALERRRRDYGRLRDRVGSFVVVDASRPLADVVDDVVAAVAEHGRGRPRTLRAWRT